MGFPISYRSAEWSARLRIYHQSSHLGDEFLLLPQPGPAVTRINLSFEAMELLGSWERRGTRLYGGGTRIFASDTRLGRDRTQVGIDYRGNPLRWRTARVVAGFDLQSWDETGWDRDYSVKAGLQFRSPYGDARSLQALLEYYSGHSPHGQFYNLSVEYVGWGSPTSSDEDAPPARIRWGSHAGRDQRPGGQEQANARDGWPTGSRIQ